jgi:hypothetical protein
MATKSLYSHYNGRPHPNLVSRIHQFGTCDVYLFPSTLRPSNRANKPYAALCVCASGPCPIPTSRFCYLRRENNALAPCFDIRFKKEKNCNKLQRQRTNMQQAWADFQSITVASRPMCPSSQLRILRLAHKPLRCRGRQGMHNIGRDQYTLRVATEKMRWVGASVVTTKAKHGL